MRMEVLSFLALGVALAAGVVRAQDAQDGAPTGARPLVAPASRVSVADATEAGRQRAPMGVPGLATATATQERLEAGSQSTPVVSDTPQADAVSQNGTGDHAPSEPQAPVVQGSAPTTPGAGTPAPTPAAPAAAGADLPRAPTKYRVKASPPPPVVDITPQQNFVMGIAFSHLNRIVTPFAEPEVKTTSTAVTSVDGSAVYISTNLDEPIGLFIIDKGHPEDALSLTLIPAELPPVQTTLRLRGASGERSVKRLVNKTVAESFERQHPFVDMVTELLRDLALGKVPDGYGLEDLRNGGSSLARAPRCDIPGLRVEPMQLVTGSSLIAYVARATAVSQSPIEIDETKCMGSGLRAVSEWPRSTLNPGESTELYMVVSAQVEAGDAATRPSVLGGAP